MKLFVRIISILSVSASLTACSVNPNMMGMSSEDWHKLTPKEHKERVANYYKVRNQRLGHELELGNATHKHYLKVGMKSGKIMRPPYKRAYSFYPLTFTIAQNSCQDVPVMLKGAGKEDSTGFYQQASFRVCYEDSALLLDPSAYDQDKAMGSLRLQRSPIWYRGFTYHDVSSDGIAHLKNVDVTVTTNANVS